MTYTLAADAALLQPVRVGAFEAGNRIFMAPLTRSRAKADGTPSDLAARYYSQRAAAGLIISEATAVSAGANGAYLNTPGMYTDRHQQKWSEIAQAVHGADGRMFVQLWHVGRMGHPDISGVESVGPSGIVDDVTTHTPSGEQPLPVARGLWFGPLVLNTGREVDSSFCQLEELAQLGVISAAAVGRPFLANPDLIDRLVLGAELNEPDATTFYAPGPAGYVDYPTLGQDQLKSA